MLMTNLYLYYENHQLLNKISKKNSSVVKYAAAALILEDMTVEAKNAW